MSTLLGQLAVKFELISEETWAELSENISDARDIERALVAQRLLDTNQLSKLKALAAFLECRYADRILAGLVREGGYVSEDEITYAFSAQEAAFRRDRSRRTVGDLLVEFGALTPERRDQLMEDLGRN